MDPTSPPRRRALAPRAQRHGHLGSDFDQKSKSRVIHKNSGRYIIFPRSEAAPLGASRIVAAGQMSTSDPSAAMETLPGNQNAPEASIPAPLAKKIKRSGMVYREFWRSDNVAIYCAKGAGPRIEYEVFRVQLLLAGEFGGRQYPVRESLPPSSSWGESGWTFTNNSHRDPLAVALVKAQQIARRAAAKEKANDE